MLKRNKTTYYWLSQLGGWGAFVLIHSVLYFALGLANGYHPYYFHSLFFLAFTGLIITHTMRSVIIGLRILSFPLGRQMVWFIGITLSFGMLYSSITASVEEAMGWEPIYYRTHSYTEKWVKNSVGAILYITIWNLSYFAYHYIISLQQRILNEAQLATLVKELELKSIKAHINPHFIFNALNGIRALVDEDPEKARNAITTLSQLLRKSLNVQKGDFATFEEELEMVKNYLSLEQIRFEDRLHVQLDIAENTLRQKIPPMMLQTLVENGIKHGISREVKGGTVGIKSECRKDYYVLTITNTGQLRAPQNEGGFGLTSTINRLQLLYSGKASFHIHQKAENTVEARVTIPCS